MARVCVTGLAVELTACCVGVQRMVERGTEGLLAVQRQVAAVQAQAEQSLTCSTSDLRHRLEELHQAQNSHQDLLQVIAVAASRRAEHAVVPEHCFHLPTYCFQLKSPELVTQHG